MTQIEQVYLSLGFLLFAGMLLDSIGRRTRVPRVTLLMLFGLLVGRSGFNLLPSQTELLFPAIAQIALLMVCFLLGGKFTKDFIKRSGRIVIAVSIAKVVGSALLVLFSLVLFGVQWEIALLLSAISTATAPAATTDVIEQSGVRNSKTNILLAVVAIDDLWGLLYFSFTLTFITMTTIGGGALKLLTFGLWEILGAFLAGFVLGIPLAYLSGRSKTGTPTQLEALGIVFLCGGVALIAHVSFLLTALVAGVVITNLATHHTRPFHEIEKIDQPFLVLFFMLAGASLEPEKLVSLGELGLCYIVFRTLGTWLGSWIGIVFSGASSINKKWFGLALLPQAGVALGMSLIASEQFPEYQSVILTVIVGTTVFFEIIGPLCTRFVIEKTA